MSQTFARPQEIPLDRLADESFSRKPEPFSLRNILKLTLVNCSTKGLYSFVND